MSQSPDLYPTQTAVGAPHRQIQQAQMILGSNHHRLPLLSKLPHCRNNPRVDKSRSTISLLGSFRFSGYDNKPNLYSNDSPPAAPQQTAFIFLMHLKLWQAAIYMLVCPCGFKLPAQVTLGFTNGIQMVCWIPIMRDIATPGVGIRDGSLQMFLAGISSSIIAMVGVITPTFTYTDQVVFGWTRHQILNQRHIQYLQ